MAARFWVGGTGNWSDSTNHWALTSGGVPAPLLEPTSSDNVTIDSNSGFGSGGTITLNTTPNMNNFTANSGHTYTISGAQNLKVYGSFTLESGITLGATTGFRFLSTSTGNTITTAGVIIHGDGVFFEGIGGGWTLQDNITVSVSSGSTSEFYQENGTFNANNFNVTANTFTFYADTGFTPTVIMGSGTWEAKGQSTHSWYVSENNSQTVTFTPGTSTIKLSSSTTDADLVNYTDGVNNVGGHTYYNFWRQAGSSNLYSFTISGSNTFNDFKSDTYGYFHASSTTTVSSFTISGTVGNLITLGSEPIGAKHTLSKSSGTVNSDYLDISDSNATGGATWNAGIHSINEGSNLGWFFTYQPVNVFDSATIAETVTANMPVLINLSDNITVAENVTSEDFFDISVSDNITIAESTTASPTTTASVSDNINISENIVSAITTWFINVSDNITINDEGVIRPTQFVSTFDNLTISEDVKVLEKGLILSVFDSITVSEFTVFSVNISVSDSMTISENIGMHRVRTGWSTNWTPDATVSTTKWKKDPN